MLRTIGLVIASGALAAAAPLALPDRPSPGAVAGLQDVFVPDPSSGRDYVATLHEGPPRSDDVQVVSRRGAWLRSDRIERGRPQTSYVGLATGLWVIVARDPQGAYTAVHLRRLGADIPYMDYRSHRTGERDTVLGEACSVWDVYRSVDPRGSGIRRQGCVTADGVELWRRTTGHRDTTLSSARAVKLERRRPPAALVEPPGDLLDLGPWTAPAGDTSQGDFEVTLAAERSDRVMTIRRHGAWAYEESPEGGRSFTSRRLDGRVDLFVGLTRDGKPSSLRFTRPRVGSDLGPAQPMNRPGEVILGETCAWFDLMPTVADAGRAECRTQDGVPLKVELTGWGGHGPTYVAWRVSRQPLRMADVLPPPHLLDRRLWGLPR